MHIVFFTHPNFLGHQSMPRYAAWLANGMQQRGHTIELWTAEPFFLKFPAPGAIKKWLGYLDQFFIFPRWAKRKMKQFDEHTLFVFTDHALGPWVPLVSNRKHIVHCHDFLAQKSALGQVPQNPTSFTGKQYQAFIRNGYSKGKNFISISHQTEKDLLTFLPARPAFSKVIYNAVNPTYQVKEYTSALTRLQNTLNLALVNGFLLHVGGNQWYKNRPCIILLYNAWRSIYDYPLPLLLLGEQPDSVLLDAIENSKYKNGIHFFSGLADTDIINAYNTASVFLFPSLAEGFGWPIAEAMACGCPVITTADAPMTEVGGNAAIYIPKMPLQQEKLKAWLQASAGILQETLKLAPAERNAIKDKGLENIKRFDSEIQLNKIAEVYGQL